MEQTLGGEVVALDDDAATDARFVGGKAAALARAARSGLPTLPGFAIAAGAARGGSLAPLAPDLRRRWDELSESGKIPLVVRSSSLVEDTTSSSMAGRFRSVLDVRSWDDFLAAVRTVLESASLAGDEGDEAAMAVLVQRQLRPQKGGVLFGADPVTGREDRLVVAVVAGGPDRLVSGDVDGARYELDRRGRVVDHRAGDGGAALARRERRALVALAEQVASTFGGPQDVEWAAGERGAIVLLQTRPVTTPLRGEPLGPVLGPGPVAETFPEPLWPLEEDLWVAPVRDGLRHALEIASAAPSSAIRRSPAVVVVGGRVAVDLDLVEGRREGSGGIAAALDPRPPVRRLRSALRTGRLRRALPMLTRHVVARADEELCAVPPVGQLSDTQLLALLERCHDALVSLHGHEMLAGLLARDPGRPVTGTGVAMAVLAEARRAGRPDGDVLAESPVVLALVPPAVGPPPRLPSAVPEAPAPGGGGEAVQEGALLREALRLRARWVQELSARVAWEIAGRLAAAGLLDDPLDVRRVRWEALKAAVSEQRRPDLDPVELRSEPLPARFRLGTRGEPIPLPAAEAEAAGAGGGCGEGPVHIGADPPPGSVLVVAQLDPGLAPVLPRLAGLVAETGSVLAHAAILAREMDVPTVVGMADARRRFPPGTRVRVDGDAGEVTVVEEAR